VLFVNSQIKKNPEVCDNDLDAKMDNNGSFAINNIFFYHLNYLYRLQWPLTLLGVFYLDAFFLWIQAQLSYFLHP
jgi:hypothetical protein